MRPMAAQSSPSVGVAPVRGQSAEASSAQLLWVTEELPDRGLGGGSIRQSHLFEALASRYSVDLLVVGSVRDPRVRASARSILEVPRGRAPWPEHPVGRRLFELAIMLAYPRPSAMYLSWPARRELARALGALPRTYDLVCVEHLALAPLRARLPAGRSVITLHHLLSGMIRQEVGLAPGSRQRLYRRLDLVKARRLEREALRSFDRVIVCSREDARTLVAGRSEHDRTAVIPNGVDLEEFVPSPAPRAPRVLFPATLGYGPNVDGAVWFCREIWPRVMEAVPAATVSLVGRSPTAEVRALAALPGVDVEGDVPSLTPYYERSRVVVVPLRTGTGTRLKALEAMASARPLVGTSIGLEGLGIDDARHALVRDDPASFAAAVTRLLRDDGLVESIGTEGRRHVESEFGWPQIGAQLVELIAEVLDPPGPEAAALRGRRCGA